MGTGGDLDRRSGYPSNAPPELTRVAQYFEGVAGRQGLDDELREVFAKAYTPGPLHYFLANSTCRVLVTTNYDCLLEKAFEEKRRSYHHVVYRNGAPTLFYARYDGETGTKTARLEVVPNELVIAKDSAPVIYKMHGSADLESAERDSYLITEDDYVQFISRMVANTAIPSLFAEPFKTSHMLFLGYGLQDWNLRVILHKIRQEWPSRRAAWAIQHKALPAGKRVLEQAPVDHLREDHRRTAAAPWGERRCRPRLSRLTSAWFRIPKATHNSSSAANRISSASWRTCSPRG